MVAKESVAVESTGLRLSQSRGNRAITRLFWTIRQLVLYVAYTQSATLQCWLKVADLKSKPVVTLLSPHGANIGGCSINSNLLAKTIGHQNSGFLLPLETSPNRSSANIPKVE
jgi:hypothetical protein